MVPKNTTTIRCPISKVVLDDKTTPVVMLDNRIYSLESVNEISRKNNGVFISPVTKTSYPAHEACKIYFL